MKHYTRHIARARTSPPPSGNYSSRVAHAQLSSLHLPVLSFTMANVADTKLYDILGVSPSASENELKKVNKRFLNLYIIGKSHRAALFQLSIRLRVRLHDQEGRFSRLAALLTGFRLYLKFTRTP